MGRGRSASKGKALELERDALAPYRDLCEALEYAGAHQGRRKIFEKPYSFGRNTMKNFACKGQILSRLELMQRFSLVNILI